MARDRDGRGARQDADHAAGGYGCAKFYRKLGREYQATMNRVLRAFMLPRLTEILSEPDRVDLDTVDELG